MCCVVSCCVVGVSNSQLHTTFIVLYACVSCAACVAELAELFQWRGEVAPFLPGWSDADRVHLGEELSDVLLYLVRLADLCGVDLPAAALRKMRRNAEKYPAERCRGKSDKYTVYAAAGAAASPTAKLLAAAAAASGSDDAGASAGASAKAAAAAILAAAADGEAAPVAARVGGGGSGGGGSGGGGGSNGVLPLALAATGGACLALACAFALGRLAKR